MAKPHRERRRKTVAPVPPPQDLYIGLAKVLLQQDKANRQFGRIQLIFTAKPVEITSDVSVTPAIEGTTNVCWN